MADFFYDTFTDTDGALLSAHTPDTNLTTGVWIDTNDYFKITSNELVRNKTSGADDFNTYIDLGRLVNSISFKLYFTSTYDARFIIRRASSTQFYAIQFHSSGDFRLCKDGIGPGAQLQGGSWSPVNGTWYNIKIVDSGSNIKVTLDGVSKIDYDTTTYNTSYNIGPSYWTGCTPKFDDIVVEYTSNNEYFKKNLLRVESNIEFQKNLGDILDTAQDITKYAVNINDINEKLTKSATNTGGVLLPSMKLKLDNSRGTWDKNGDKFKNGFINNSLVKITTNYLDDGSIAITPSFVFEGIMKYSSSSWDRDNFLFETTLTNPSAVIASEKIQPGILSNNTFKNIVFKILNRQPFAKYMTIDIDNFSMGWDVTTNSITDMVNKKVKNVLDEIMLLTGSFYYVDYDNNFIIEPIQTVSPSASVTLRGEDIFKVRSEDFYWKGQYTSIVWDDDTNPVQRVEMNYTDRTLYQYDFTELKLNYKYVTNTTNRSSILDNLLDLYKFLKRKVKLECKWNPEIKINDYISLDVPKEAIKDDDLFIWNENQWNDNKYWGINQPGISFSSSELWRVIELKRDTLGTKMQLTLIQLYSDDEV